MSWRRSDGRRLRGTVKASMMVREWNPNSTRAVLLVDGRQSEPYFQLACLSVWSPMKSVSVNSLSLRDWEMLFLTAADSGLDLDCTFACTAPLGNAVQKASERRVLRCGLVQPSSPTAPCVCYSQRACSVDRLSKKAPSFCPQHGGASWAEVHFRTF